MNFATIALSRAILESLRNKGKFAQFKLPHFQHTAITLEAKVLAEDAHLNFYAVPTQRGVNLMACPPAGDWTWKVEVVV